MLDVYVYGSGECDQLGLPDFDEGESKIPRKVLFNTELSNKVYKIACGGMHSLVLTTLGTIYSWGCNDDGALGREGADNEPGLVSGINFPIENISAGDSHSIVYNSEINVMYKWGAYRDNSGKLADPIRSPEQIDTLRYFKNQRISKVVCGANHTLVLSGNSLYAWGNQESGQTGINPKASKKIPPLYPNKFATKNVLDIFTALNHSFLICRKGTGSSSKAILKGWGFNKYGQLGTGNKENQWIPQEIEFFNDKNIKIFNATGGDYHTIFLTDINELYVCGKNDEGQCGIPKKEHFADVINEEKIIITERIMEEKKNGDMQVTTTKLEITGLLNDDDEGNEKEFENCEDEHDDENDDIILTPLKLEFFNVPDKKVNQIYSSMNFNYALDKNNNQVYSWGLGYSYVLGNKKEDNENTPFIIPKQFFKNLSVDQIALGSQHVTVGLFDPLCNLPHPILEYNIEEIKKSLRKEVEEKKIKTGKRKTVITKEEVKEEIKAASEEKVKRGRRKVEVKQEKIITRSTSKKGERNYSKNKSIPMSVSESKPVSVNKKDYKEKNKSAAKPKKIEEQVVGVLTNKVKKSSKNQLNPKEKYNSKSKGKSKANSSAKSTSKSKTKK